MTNLAIDQVRRSRIATRCVVLMTAVLVLTLALAPLNSQNLTALTVLSENMPPELITHLNDLIAKQEDILSVSVSRSPAARQDEYVVNADLEAIAGINFKRFYEGESKNLGPLTAIWLHPRHPDYAVFRFGSFEYRETDNAPGELPKFIEKLREAQKMIRLDKKLSIGDIAFPPTSGWIFLVVGASNRYYQNGAPPKLVDAIDALKQDQTVTHVAVGAGNAWVLIHDRFNFQTSDNLPPSMVAALALLKQKQKSIHVLALHPVTRGWLVVAEK
jgi:hypothetical protein